MNTTDLANGKVNYFNSTYEADYKLSFIDKVHIAITCTQRGWFDNSLGKEEAQNILDKFILNADYWTVSFSVRRHHQMIVGCLLTIERQNLLYRFA